MRFTKSIKKNNTFSYILSKGRYFKAKYLTVYISSLYRNNKVNYLGICVNKKHGISVHRNKMKRWVREVYKYEEPLINKGYNIIVLFKRGVTLDMLNYNIVKDDIKTAFKELNIYEKN